MWVDYDCHKNQNENSNKKNKIKQWNNQFLKLIIKMQFYFLKYLLRLKNKQNWKENRRYFFIIMLLFYSYS